MHKANEACTVGKKGAPHPLLADSAHRRLRRLLNSVSKAMSVLDMICGSMARGQQQYPARPYLTRGTVLYTAYHPFRAPLMPIYALTSPIYPTAALEHTSLPEEEGRSVPLHAEKRQGKMAASVPEACKHVNDALSLRSCCQVASK